MKELKYNFSWIYGGLIINALVLTGLFWAVYYDFSKADLAYFELEGYVDGLPFLIAIIWSTFHYLNAKIVKVNSKGIQVFSIFDQDIAKRKIDKKEVLGLKSQSNGWWHRLSIVTNNETIPMSHLKDSEKTEKWLIEKYSFLSLSKSSDQGNDSSWGCLKYFLMSVIFFAFSKTVRDIDSWPSVQAWKQTLPLQDVLVADFTGTLKKDIIIRESHMNDGDFKSKLRLKVEEYPMINFAYSPNSELSNAIANLQVNDTIPSGSSIQLKLRPRDLKFLQYGTAPSKEKRNLSRRSPVQVFSIESNNQLLLEKCCLRE